MVDLYSLNKQQRQAVEHLLGPLVILAGAGTGKTRVITTRIAHMLRQQVPPEKILAVTFTNKAAREMRERVRQLAGKKGNKIHAGTFHSFCLKVLRKYYKAAGLERYFAIVGSADQVDLVRKSLEEKGLSGVYRPEQIHAAISQCKNNLWGPEDLEGKDAFFSVTPEIVSDCYRLYERQLKLNHVIDFDDCIFKVVKLLKENEKICNELSESHQYIMIDEFQDTNLSQLEVIRLLTSKHNNICVVGDDDQSIYSWRGASSKVFKEFDSLFPKRKLIKLEENYRSTNTILNAANLVITNNPNRYDKKLWSSLNGSKPIELMKKEDETSEANWIAQKCFGLLGRGCKPQDIAILYRANVQNKALEIAFRELRLHYKVYGGQSLFEKREIKDILGYLKLITNPKDRHGFWRIINVPNRGLGLKSLEAIEALAKKHKKTPFSVLKDHIEELPKRSHRTIQEFVETIGSLSALKIRQPHDIRELTDRIIKDFRLRSYYRSHSINDSQASKRSETLASLPKWLDEISSGIYEEKGALSLHDLMDHLTLDDKKNEKEENKNHISLMTIHAAKGLEFPVVFVCGLDDERLPHKNSTTSQQVEEERRLFYVALTRAKEELFLSYAKRKPYGKIGGHIKPSRFLEELPDLNLKVEAPNKEETAKRTMGRLSRLRQELKDQPL